MPDNDISNALPTEPPDPQFVAETRDLLSAAWANPELYEVDTEPSPAPEAEPEPTASRTTSPTGRSGGASPRAWIVPSAAAVLIVFGAAGLLWRNGTGTDEEISTASTTVETSGTGDSTDPETMTSAETTVAPTTPPSSTEQPTTTPPSTLPETTVATTIVPVTIVPPTPTTTTTVAPTTTSTTTTTAPTTTTTTTTTTSTTIATKPSTPDQLYPAAEIPEWARISVTAPVAKFPADGVYASGLYELDGDRVTFQLEQRFMGRACWDHFARDPDVESICAANEDFVADGQVAEPSATITADAKASVVATFFVPPTDDQVATYSISYDEFIRGLNLETTNSMPARDFRLLVRNGRVVSIVSMWHAGYQLAPWIS